MSKVDAQRAMREARFELLNKQAALAAQRTTATRGTRTPAPRTSTSRTSTSTTPTPSTSTPEPAAVEAAETEALCGHRSISNKSCQRPKGHSEKNHRYS